MDLTAFLDGFALVVEPKNLLYCLAGVLIGMIIGVLPGLGPAATIAILLPITYTIDPVSAIIMLAGNGEDIGRAVGSRQRSGFVLPTSSQVGAHSHVLEVGSGSGGPAVYLAAARGCHVPAWTSTSTASQRRATCAARGVAERCRFEQWMRVSRFRFRRPASMRCCRTTRCATSGSPGSAD